MGLVRRGVPAESAVEVWAVLCGFVFEDLGGEQRSMTSVVADVASKGSMGSSVDRFASVFEAVS